MPQKRKQLPKNAKRVFKGVIFDVWQWKQKMFDGSFATFERITRPDTCLVIPVVGKKIMVLKQRQPDWKKYSATMAGGSVEENEKPLIAGKRELLEETGYISKDWYLWKRLNPQRKIIFAVHFYIARNCILKQMAQPDRGEIIKTELLTFEEFLNLSKNPSFYAGELKNQLIQACSSRKARNEFHNLLFKK